MALPPVAPGMTKSCTRTRCGVLAGRHARPPFLKGPDQFLLLGVHRDRRLPPALGGPHLPRDVAKLRVPIRMLPAFARLDVALQAVAEAVQQLGDHRVADGVTERLEGHGQRARAQAGPPQRRLRIAGRRRFDQRVQVAQQRGLVRGRPLPPSAGLAHPVAGKGASASSSVSPRLIVAGESPVARATSGDARRSRGLGLPSPPTAVATAR